MSSGVPIVDWHNLYSGRWGTDITPDAYVHPAKYARGLIRQIYRHALDCGWLIPGDSVVDPFGGVALGALDAMLNGLNWTGVELEERFFNLGNGNIALWESQYGPHFPSWGTARLLNGDSRYLGQVINGAAAVVSSPPYIDSVNSDKSGIDWNKAGRPDRLVTQASGIQGANGHEMEYGETSGQLGAMKEGSFAAAISSPPYANGEKGHPSLGSVNKDDWGNDGRDIARRRGLSGEYGETPGQLASLPEGHFAAAISSPPYANMTDSWNEGPGARFDPERHPGNPNKQSNDNGYGDTNGNLGNMREGDGFAAAISSPPFENSASFDNVTAGRVQVARDNGISNSELVSPIDMEKLGLRNQEYGVDPANIGNDAGETFWSAAAIIVGQTYQILKPGGVSIWVCKDFVRKKKRVPFSDRWQALCESVGFVPVERIRAWVIEDNGTQAGLFGEDKPNLIQRKSFFRLLAERNGSPRIDWEDVIVMQKVNQ